MILSGIYAREGKRIKDLLLDINTLKPPVLIGVGKGGKAFAKEVFGAMSRLNKRPAIFALTNPNDNSECRAQKAYEWSERRAIFAASIHLEQLLESPNIFIAHSIYWHLCT